MSKLERMARAMGDAPRLNRPAATTPPVGGPDLITPAVLEVLRERLQIQLRLDRSRGWDDSSDTIEAHVKLVLHDPNHGQGWNYEPEVICEASDSVSLPSTETNRY